MTVIGQLVCLENLENVSHLGNGGQDMCGYGGRLRSTKGLNEDYSQETGDKTLIPPSVTLYELLKYISQADKSQIKLANPVFLNCFNLLYLQMGGGCH